MSTLTLGYGLLRFAAGVRSFARNTMTTEAATATVRARMAGREAAFLRMVEHAVFRNPRSPYRALFRAAGCELEDVRALVARDGVEGTLRGLWQAGVYVTLAEFKGQRPAQRGSVRFTFRPEDFDNPLIWAHYVVTSGGSAGPPTRILIDLEHIAETAPYWAVWFAAHGWLERPLVFLAPEHPGLVNRQLRCVRFGKPYARWFVTGGGGGPTYRLVSAYVQALTRWATGAPRPELVPLADVWRAGEALLQMVEAGGPPCVMTSPSTAVRLCLAMQERGRTLGGVTFLLGGEPVTAARRRTIEAVGARGVATYGCSEAGPVGVQCPTPNGADDVHLCTDGLAVIQRAREVGNAAGVGAILVTNFRRAAPKIMLNVEIGDYAVHTQRRCGCRLDELGYDQHLEMIRSFTKLTGEGVTFIGADVFPILEEALPRRFGGAIGDYQLVEQQDAEGLPRYVLLVSPEVGPLDEPMLVATFWRELAGRKRAYPFMVDQWKQGRVLRVERRRPHPTARGKVPPFRTLGADGANGG